MLFKLLFQSSTYWVPCRLMWVRSIASNLCYLMESITILMNIQIPGRLAMGANYSLSGNG